MPSLKRRKYPYANPYNFFVARKRHSQLPGHGDCQQPACVLFSFLSWQSSLALLTCVCVTAVTPLTAIYCFKKALFLINAISIRFGAKDPPPFPVPHVSHLPVFADSVLPSILIHLGVIDLSTAASPALISLFPTANAGAASASASGAAELAAAAVPEPAQLLLAAAAQSPAESPARNAIVDGPALTPAQSYILRAAAIEACERIVERAHAMSAAGRGAPWLKDVTLPDLDHWLWAVAKDRADYRALPRFVLRNTPFF